MSNRFPAVTTRQVLRVLRQCGFAFFRTGKGSHEFYIRERDRRIVMLSKHPHEIIRRGTLANILHCAGLTVEEFKKML